MVIFGVTGSAAGLVSESMTVFLVGLAGGLAGVVVSWFGLGSKLVEKKVDAALADRQAMWKALMERDKWEPMERMMTEAYRGKLAARNVVNASQGAERRGHIVECETAGVEFTRLITENRRLLNTTGAFGEAHKLKATLLTFRNAANEDDPDLAAKFEQVDKAFEAFNAATQSRFPSSDQL
jgi:hypothetical protein